MNIFEKIYSKQEEIKEGPEKAAKNKLNKKTALVLGLALNALQPLPVFSQAHNLDTKEISINNDELDKDKINEIQENNILTIKDFYQKKIEQTKNSVKYLDYQNFSEEELSLFKHEHEESLVRYQAIIDNPQEYYENLQIEIEDIRSFLLEHFKSNDFLERLKDNYSLEGAKIKQKEIIGNLESVKIEIDSPDNIQEIIDGQASYSVSKNRILIPFDNYDFEVIAHEFLHGAYQVVESLSKKEIRLLRKSFSKDKNVSKEKNEYQSSPEERIVRKKLLDLEMERLGIKKYREQFDDSHYKQLLELREEFKLSRAAKDLLRTSTAKQLKNLMNTIAFYDAISVDEEERELNA
jgi:hypothetical protein